MRGIDKTDVHSDDWVVAQFSELENGRRCEIKGVVQEGEGVVSGKGLCTQGARGRGVLMTVVQQVNAGFAWGQVEVHRMAEFQGNKCIRVGVAGDKFYDKGVNIYVSPTGRSIRVFKDGRELK